MASTTSDIVWDGVQRGYDGIDIVIPDVLPLHDDAAEHVDPVTFEVIRYSLMNTNIEHGETLQRLCVSPITMIARDFQPSILSHDGELVFLGPYLQYFSNAQSLTIRWILENRAEDPGIEEGDVFVSNDPFVGSPHQPDTVVAVPIFVEGRLFGWVSNILHHADVGGSVMGSFCVDATDIFMDPPVFPPFKIASRGKIRTDVEQMFLRQSRVPTSVHMDMRAAISANLVAAQKISALVQRYGASTVKAVMNGVIEAGEKVTADRLSRIPDGSWTHRIYAEAAHTGDTGTYVYELTLRKEGGYLYVDNRGTDPQTGSINVAYAGLVGAFFAALTASLTSDLAGAYGGVYRRVRFDLEPGTLSSADFPAAVSPSGVYTMETLISLSGTVIAKMLASSDPEIARLAIGPSHATFYGTVTGGAKADGTPFIASNANNMIGSISASPAGDGVDFGGHFWIPDGRASNVEELELLWPVLFLYRKALPAGADGAGEYRGGRGFVEGTIPWGVPGLGIAIYMDESFPKTVGTFGANPGAVGRFRLKHGSNVLESFGHGQVPVDFDDITGAEPVIAAKGPTLLVGADAVWEWTGANAAGFGDPLRRDPAAVVTDVADGALAPADAERVYGVVLAGDGRGHDPAATESLRRELLSQRLASAELPDDVVLLDPHAELRPVAAELGVSRLADGSEVFVTVSGRVILGPTSRDPKFGSAVKDQLIREFAREYGTNDSRAGWTVRYREYLCPVTGYRIDSEILRDGDEPIRGSALDGPFAESRG
ncbi:MAG: hydantoinase B/oxoprolinase family protein [Blastococcus sp.]